MTWPDAIALLALSGFAGGGVWAIVWYRVRCMQLELERLERFGMLSDRDDGNE